MRRFYYSMLVFVGSVGPSLYGSFLYAANEVTANTDPFDLPQVVAVENKKFNPMKDITLQMGILPLDAFYKALTIGVTYTQNFNSYLSWEVINANYATVQDTNLKRDLLDNFSVKPAGILDSIKYHVGTHVVYTPIYSKNLFFNKEVMHGEWSFVGGAGMVGYTSGDTAVMYGGGLIGRFFKNNSISYKFDVRLYSQTAQNKSSDLLLMLNLGLSFEIGGRTQMGRSL